MIHDDGAFFVSADSNGGRVSRLVNASPRFENQRPRRHSAAIHETFAYIKFT